MVTLTMMQAEEFFKAFDGRKFHMDRDEPYKYQLYERLNIPKETEERWRAELAAQKEQGNVIHKTIRKGHEDLY